MQAFSELIPPSAVSHAVSLPFLTPSYTNLVVAKTSLLQIFALRTPHGEKQVDSEATKKEAVLSLVGEYPLSGSVTSLAKIKVANTKTGADALLVSFKDAKVSLLEWDPENHRISTISIHYYEGSKVPHIPFEPPASDWKSKLVVDPRGRCAALRFASRRLAIIPFLQPEDDLADLEDDFLEDQDPKPEKTHGDLVEDKSGHKHNTPYAASFVLATTTLDPALTHVVDMAFLYEYREPTFGIVSANKSASLSLLHERKDLLSYTVITLDLEQKASTSLLSVKGLPYDIWKVLPLPTPIGGALLVGINELVHIDQSGKANAVGVNEYARQCSDFSIADQSGLDLKLENCCIETLNPDTGDLLIILESGRLVILTFKIDGRTISGLQLHPVADRYGGVLPASSVSAAALLPNNHVFVGSDVGASSLVRWSAKQQQSARKRSHAQMLGEDMGFEIDEADLEDDDEDDAEDDLYADGDFSKSTAHRIGKNVAPDSYFFKFTDHLPSLAGVSSLVVGRATESNKRQKLRGPPLQLLAAVDEGTSSRLVRITRDLTPRTINAHADSTTNNIFPIELTSTDGQTVRHCILSETDSEGKENSKLMRLDQQPAKEGLPWSEVQGTEFEEEGRTYGVYTLSKSQRIIHVRESEVRTYDTDFGLSQIFPVLDPESEDELQVIHSAFYEPYLLLLRADSSVELLKADGTGELDEIECGDTLRSRKWLSACLWKNPSSNQDPLAFLLSDDGCLSILELPDFTRIAYSAPQLAALPAVLTTEDRQRRAASKAVLSEILFTDLGTTANTSPYLIARSSTDEIILYEPFYHNRVDGVKQSYCDGLRFRKVPGLHLPKYEEEAISFTPGPMRAFQDIDGRAVAFIPGESPAFVMKEPSSLPRLVDFRSEPVKFMSLITAENGTTNLLYVDVSGTLYQAALPDKVSLAINGCVVETLDMELPGHEIHDIAYHPDRDLYAVISSKSVDFHPAEDDTHHDEDQGVSMRPKTDLFHLHLFHAAARTILDTHSFPPYEIVTSLVAAPLEVSENTHRHEYLISVGTITRRVDAYADKGAVYTYCIIEVVPEPDRPETAFKLRPITREDTRAGITAMTGIAGLIGTAQGQKLMLRGLRDDNQNLPVAFLDAQTYTVAFKTLQGSGMWLAADYWKGLWFGGFTEEPPKMSVFGRTPPRGCVVEAEFLPHEADGALHLIAADERGTLHVWQFDPEHPKSLGGTRLIHRSSFHAGHLVTKMLLLPNAKARRAEDEPALHQVLTAARSGQIGLVTPLDEAQYRRLSTLQNQLANVLEQAAGLNPRAYRDVRSEGGVARGVVDGTLLARIGELGAGRRGEIVGRVAGEGGWWEIRTDLELLAGRGLDYF